MIETNKAQAIWQSQPVEGIPMSAEMIRNRAGKFERKVFWRNVREYVSSALATVMFVFFFVKTDRILPRIAYVLFVTGIVWVVIQLRRKGTPKNLPSSLGTSPSLTFFRSEMERQRDLVKTVLTWYLAPMVPGFLVLTLDIALRMPFPASLGSIALMDGGVAVLFFVVWKLNARAAQCLQRTIDELRAAEN